MDGGVECGIKRSLKEAVDIIAFLLSINDAVLRDYVVWRRDYYVRTDPELTMSPSEFIGSFKANFSQCDFLVIHKRAADTFTALVKAKTLITTDIPS